MKQFSCGDVIPGCKATFRAADEQTMLAQVAAHAREAHGMHEIPESLPPVVLSHLRDVQADD